MSHEIKIKDLIFAEDSHYKTENVKIGSKSFSTPIKALDLKKNITDISPLHALWIRKNSNEKVRDEIRKFKYFLKINDLYGAESYIRGFSGYIAEILVIYYKSFNNLIKN